MCPSGAGLGNVHFLEYTCDWAYTAKTIGELRSVLGLLGYYRCYVKDFARKVKPLYDIMKGK